MLEEPMNSEKLANTELFRRQKEMLLCLAERGAISKQYCEREITVLTEKMACVDTEAGKSQEN